MCADEFAGCTSLVILFGCHEQKIASKEANEEKKRRAADGRACSASDAVRPLHHLWLQRAGPAGGGSRAGSRQSEWKDGSPGARTLAVPDRRRFYFAAVRLPRAARTFDEKNRPGSFGHFALSSPGRPRHRADEQAAGLRIAGRRDGHGGSKRDSGLCGGRTRLRILRENPEKTRREENSCAKKIRLLSNNPEKVRQLENFGIRVVERVPCQPRISKISRAYLKTKKRKMGHLLEGI